MEQIEIWGDKMEESRKDTQRAPLWITCIATLVIAVFSIIQVHYYNKQTILSERALQSDRAWLLNDVFEAEKNGNAGMPVEGTYESLFRIKNFGKSPALDVCWKFVSKILSDDVRVTISNKPEELFPENNNEFRCRHDVSSVGEVHVIMTSLNTKHPDNKTLIDGRQSVYIIGVITYKDIYGKKHYTKICSRGKKPYLLDSCDYGNDVGDVDE